MKKILSIALLACFTLAFANAQHKRGHHKGDRLEMMKKELNLTDEQVKILESRKAVLDAEMKEIRESDLDKEAKREKMKALRQKGKTMMDDVLTAEQRAKAETLKTERKSKFEDMRSVMKEKKEKMKPMMEEIKAYKKEKVEPFMVAQRVKLDKAMKKKDRKFIDGIREDLKKDKEEMKAKMKAKKEEFKTKRKEWKEKGGEDMGERPHHKMKGHHRGGPHPKKGKMMHHLQEKYGDQIKDIKTIAEKYSSDIEKLEGEIKVKKAIWDKDISAIKAKHGFDKEDMKHPHHKKRMKGQEGKPSCKKGDKSCCTKEEAATCCPKDAKKKSDKPCCTEEEAAAYKKGKKSDKTDWKAKKADMKKIGFLLMPSEPRDEGKTLDKQTQMISLESKVYPNPSSNSNTLEINVKEAGQYKVELFDNAGKQIKKIASEKLSEGTKSYQVDLSDLTPGAYYYSIESPSGRKTVKFVKR